VHNREPKNNYCLIVVPTFNYVHVLEYQTNKNTYKHQDLIYYKFHKQEDNNKDDLVVSFYVIYNKDLSYW
jgi:hypothetical protein